jgi:hypothetical protein
VHLEEAERCVDLYVSSMTTAGLLTADGDRVTHVANEDLAVTIAPAAATDPASAISPAKQRLPSDKSDSGGDFDVGVGLPEGADHSRTAVLPNHSAPQAVFHVNVTLDSSMDIEKLQKQLELLKRFGAI